MNTEQRITISLTQEQYNDVADALEFTSRFLSGQLDVYALPGGLMHATRMRERREPIEQALDNLKAHLFPELHGRGHSHGVGADQTTEPIARQRVVLYEVYRTMLEYRVQQRIAAGEDVGPNVYAHPGLNYTGLPKPTIQPEQP